MKRILLLVMLALTICCTAFAGHTPSTEELYKIQQTFSGYHYAQDPDILKKYGLIKLTFNDDNSVEFLFKNKEHIIEPANITVDYNNGFNVSVDGKCIEPDCTAQDISFLISTKAQIVVPRKTSFLLVAIIINKDKTYTNDSIWTCKM